MTVKPVDTTTKAPEHAANKTFIGAVKKNKEFGRQKHRSTKRNSNFNQGRNNQKPESRGKLQILTSPVTPPFETKGEASPTVIHNKDVINAISGRSFPRMEKRPSVMQVKCGHCGHIVPEYYLEEHKKSAACINFIKEK
jgi:hypothetical protein